MDYRFTVLEARTGSEIKQRLSDELIRWLDLFPKNKSARIILKPNLNSNMNALTGNTTDLRVLSAIILFLQSQGYHNLAIAEGTNSGFYRNNISVIQRLKVDELGRHYNVEVIDLNHCTGVDIPFENGIKAQIAKPILEADFLINIPKLKMHFEVGITGCLKNLMGTLVGQDNKKKTHDNLCKNILNINKKIKPDLHIIDAIIAMEGTGPTRGTPARLDCLLLGIDPYLLDLACAYLTGFEPMEARLISEAERQGFITPEHHQFLRRHPYLQYRKTLNQPKVNRLVGFIHSPKRQKYFLRIRNTPLFNYICDTDWAQDILFSTGLRQDKFLKDELQFEQLTVNDRCKPDCTVCRDYCPVELDLPNGFKENLDGCIQCMYCYSVCPEDAIDFHGKKGFFTEQENQYARLIRALA